MLCIGFLDAQYYYLPNPQAGKNPGSLNKDPEYPPGGGLPTTWVSILVGPQSSSNWTTNRTMPFKFYFNGGLVPRYKVSASGVLTFNTATPLKVDSVNTALPSPLIPDSSICIWGLHAKASDYIVSKTFGTAPNRQHWIGFYSYSERNLDAGWIYMSIVLEETTNKIYIVDQRTRCQNAQGVECTINTNLTLGIQIDSNTAIMVNSSPDYVSDNQNNPLPDDNSYYEFINGTQPSHDVLGLRHEVGKFYAVKSFPIDLTGIYRNIGTETITDVTYNYSINNGPVFTQNITGLSAATLDDITLVHPDPITINSKGTYNIKSWISMINNNAPVNEANDTINSTLNVFDTSVTRQMLHENWTSSTCPPCKPGNETLHSVLNNYSPDQWTEINYHYFFPGTGDPYYTIESVARGRFYAPINTANGNVYISAIPATVLDGQIIINPNGYTNNQFEEYQQVPAFYEIFPSGKVSGQDVDINIEIKTYAPTTSTTRLYVALCEKLTFNNVKSNGEVDFPHVMKKMLPDTNGLLVGALGENTTKSFNIKYSVPGTYRLPLDAQVANRINLATEHSIEEFEDLEVIAWLQESDKTVLQSNSADLEFVVSNDNPIVKKQIAVNPNPASEFFFVDMSSFDDGQELKVLVADGTGKLVYAEKTALKSLFINSTNWTPGIYHVKVLGKNQEANKKIVVLD